MILTELEKIDAGLLKRLCNERCPESQTLDFKRLPPGKDAKGKSEVLKDVCSMANSEGGDIVYGIGEDKEEGGASEIFPISGESEDELLRRVGQVLDAGLEPRIVGLRLKTVKVDTGYVFIIRIPASFNGPHRYTLDGNSKFVMRNGTHTSELTYDQLRGSFDRTATLTDRAREFRSNRLEMIGERQTVLPMMPGPICAVHLIPIAGLAGRRTVDVLPVFREIRPLMFTDWGGGASRIMNFDGVLAYPHRDEKGVPSYSLVFRNGSIEFSRHGGRFIDDDATTVPATTVTDFFRNATVRAIEIAKLLGMAGPAVLGFALLDVKDVTWGTSSYFSHRGAPKGDRRHMILPETWIEGIDLLGDVDTVVQPMLDLLWQCFGSERCPDYTNEGVWKPRP